MHCDCMRHQQHRNTSSLIFRPIHIHRFNRGVIHIQRTETRIPNLLSRTLTHSHSTICFCHCLELSTLAVGSTSNPHLCLHPLISRSPPSHPARFCSHSSCQCKQTHFGIHLCLAVLSAASGKQRTHLCFAKSKPDPIQPASPSHRKGYELNDKLSFRFNYVS